MNTDSANAGEQGGKGSVFLLLCPEQSSFNASFSLARGLRESGYRIVYADPLEWQEAR